MHTQQNCLMPNRCVPWRAVHETLLTMTKNFFIEAKKSTVKKLHNPIHTFGVYFYPKKLTKHSAYSLNQDFTVFLEGMHLRMLLWVPLIPISTKRSVTFQHLVFIANTGCCRSAIKQKYIRMKQNWSGQFCWGENSCWSFLWGFLFFSFFLKQRGSPVHKRTLEKTAVSLEGAHLHTFTCGTAYTKMIWITLFLHLLASSAVVSVVNFSLL